MKTLRRQIIIRENEYITLCAKFARTKLYDRADCDTMIYSRIQHENLLAVLKNPNLIYREAYQRNASAYQILIDRRAILYNQRYLDWMSYIDSVTGEFWIQPNRYNAEEDRLVLATFEKDLP